MENNREIVYSSMDRTSQQIEEEREKAVRFWSTVRANRKISMEITKSVQSDVFFDEKMIENI